MILKAIKKNLILYRNYIIQKGDVVKGILSPRNSLLFFKDVKYEYQKSDYNMSLVLLKPGRKNKTEGISSFKGVIYKVCKQTK